MADIASMGIESNIPMSYKFGPTPMEQINQAFTIKDLISQTSKRDLESEKQKLENAYAPAVEQRAADESAQQIAASKQSVAASQSGVKIAEAGEARTAELHPGVVAKANLDIAELRHKADEAEHAYLGQMWQGFDSNWPKEKQLDYYAKNIYPFASQYQSTDKEQYLAPDQMDINKLHDVKNVGMAQSRTVLDTDKKNLEDQKLQLEWYKAMHPNKPADVGTSTLNKGQLSDLATFGKSLEGVRSVMGVVKQKIIRAEALEALVNAFGKDPKSWNKLQSRQIAEAAMALQNMLSPGGTSEHQVNELIPKSIRGNASKTWEWVTNNPTGMGQGKFIDFMVGTIEREKETAQNQVNRELYQRTAAYPRLKGTPELQELLETNGIDYTNWLNKGREIVPKAEGEPEKPGATLTDEDKAAIKWAKANPDKPQAKKILEMHGVK